MTEISSRAIVCATVLAVLLFDPKPSNSQSAAPAGSAPIPTTESESTKAFQKRTETLDIQAKNDRGRAAAPPVWAVPFPAGWAFWPQVGWISPWSAPSTGADGQAYDPAAEKAWDDIKNRMSRVILQYGDDLESIARRAFSEELTTRQAALDYRRIRQIRGDLDAFIKSSTVGKFRLIHRPDLFEVRREARRLHALDDTVTPVLFAKATSDRLPAEGRRLAASVDALERRVNDVESFWKKLPEGRVRVQSIIERTQGLDPSQTRKLAADVARVLEELKAQVVALRPLDLVTPSLEESVVKLEGRLSIVQSIPPTPKWYDGLKLLEEGLWTKVIVTDQEKSGTVDINSETPRLIPLSALPPVNFRDFVKAGPPNRRADKGTDGVMLSAGVPLKVFWKRLPRLSNEDPEDDPRFMSRGPYYVTYFDNDGVTIRPNPEFKEDVKKRRRNAQKSVASQELIYWPSRRVLNPPTTEPLLIHVLDVGRKTLSIEIPAPRADLLLISSLNDASGIPREGKNLSIVANVDEMLVIRVFDVDGTVIRDIDEKKLFEAAPQIEDLRKELAGLWPPHVLTESQKDRVISAVTSIVGHSVLSKPIWPIIHERANKSICYVYSSDGGGGLIEVPKRSELEADHYKSTEIEAVRILISEMRDTELPYIIFGKQGDLVRFKISREQMLENLENELKQPDLDLLAFGAVRRLVDAYRRTGKDHPDFATDTAYVDAIDYLDKRNLYLDSLEKSMVVKDIFAPVNK